MHYARQLKAVPHFRMCVLSDALHEFKVVFGRQCLDEVVGADEWPPFSINSQLGGTPLVLVI